MKKATQKFLSIILALCIILTFLPATAQATSTYNAGNAVAYAASHWNDGVGLCAEFVSNCLNAGGLSSWNRECTNLYNQLNNEVVSGSRIASIQYLTTYGNYIRPSDNVGKVAKGDVLFWLCSGCPTDSVGGPYQHTALISDVSGTYVKVYQHNNAMNNENAWVGNCYECGRRYSHMVVVHFGQNSSSTQITEYFSCDVQVNTTRGKTVNLYSKPTDGSRKTYFDQGQTAYSTRGAKLSDGSTWYEIQAIDNGKVVTVWLNSASSGVTVINKKVEPSLSFSPSSLSMNVGTSKTVSIKFAGDDVQSIGGSINGQSLCDVSWGNTNWSAGTTSLTVTGKKAGTATITVNLMDKNGKTIYSKSFTATFADPTYTVSYNANGGSGAPSSQVKQHDKTLMLSSTKPTRFGYIFKGWATSSGASSAQYQPGASYTSNKDLALYAVWKPNKVAPSLSFSPSSLSMNVGTSTTVSIKFAGDDVRSIGGSINGQSLCDVSWGNTNWSAGTTSLTVAGKKAGTATITVNLMDKDGKIICSKSFTATFADPTYTVSYNANGGSGAPSSQTKQYDKTLTLSSVKPTRTGYTFKGWATSSGASTTQYQPGASYTSNKDLTLYAVWELNKVTPTLSFSPSSLSMTVGTSKTVAIKFAGDSIYSIGGTINGQSLCDVSWGNTNWSTGTTSLTVTGKKAGTATITVNLMDKDGKTIYSKSFTATFVDPTYTVSYNANGGSGAPSSQIKQYNKALTLSSTKPTRNGYNFIGWAESSNASSAQYQSGDSYTSNKSLTLYAVWMTATPDHQHDLSYNRGTSSTCTEGGTQEYWGCAGCGKRFADSSTKSEIADVHLEPLGHNYADGICTRCGIADLNYPHTPVVPVNGVHFLKQRAYVQGYFTDIYPNQWFTASVAEAYEFSLMQGKSNRLFDPYGNVTLAEAITMACRIHSIYTKGYEDIPQSDGAWYQRYLDYAYANGIISWSDYNSGNVGSAATRAQFAQIMAKALPKEGFPAINSVADNAIPDVSMAATFAPAVYQLYRAGILSGGDARGTFSPGTYITRAESAAIVARIAESENRSHFTLS